MNCIHNQLTKFELSNKKNGWINKIKKLNDKLMANEWMNGNNHEVTK